MQEQLKNIFVTKEVAKLAKEKGFDEICAGFFTIKEDDIFSNSDSFAEFIFEPCANPEKFIEAPTHFQLIQWLLKNHEIDVWHSFNEWDAMPKYSESKSFVSIDEALIFALNQINQQENGK
jgi:hypothetical protein